MVGSVWPQLALVGVLVLLNAAFAGSEMALVSLREGQLQRLAASSSTGAVLARLARDPNRFMATIQIGITLAGFLASASAAVSLSGPLEEPLSFLGGAARPVAIVAVTLVLSYVTLVAGELAPKRIAMQRAERWGLVVARPLAVLATMARPVVWLLSVSTDRVVRLCGGDPSLDREEVTEEELRDLVAAQQSFTPHQRLIIDGAIEISERPLRAVLRPRPDVFTVDAAWSCSTARHELAASGHSRAPVCPGRALDGVLGVVHLRDLLSDDPGCTTASVATPVAALPEMVSVLFALRELQHRRQQMAIVVNEHGGAEGIVTVEDLVEELVGEIYDESDRDVLSVRHEEEDAVVLPGRFPVHDLADVGVVVPAGDYDTVAGFVLARLQRIPEAPGDVVTEGDHHLQVLGVDGNVITEVRISPVRDAASPAPSATAS